jgi:hypothetical protein
MTPVFSFQTLMSRYWTLFGDRFLELVIPYQSDESAKAALDAAKNKRATRRARNLRNGL